MKKKEDLVEKSLKYSNKDGIAATITASAGDNFISAYAVALKATNFQIGLLSALPNLIPTELFTSKAMKIFSRKTIVTAGVLLQILIWPLIALLGILALSNQSFSPLAPILLIVIYTLYVSTGLFISPAWASWMKDLTENIKLGKYFGIRNKIFGIVGLITIILAGFALNLFEKANIVFLGFALIFLIAAISRAVSRGYLKKQYEPKLKIKKEFYFSFWQFIKKAPSNNYGRFAIFIAMINLTVAIASPFFAPYLLNELKFGYMNFTLIQLVISSAATLLTMPLWGKFLDKHGCINTMKATAWAIPIVPILWLVSGNFYWLAFVQIISGIIWAGFNLAAGTFTYHAVTKERMNLCIAYSSILNGIGVFLGATIGGLIASLDIKFMSIFLFVFLISGIARIIAIAFLFPLVREVKPVTPAKPLFKLISRPLKEINHNLMHLIFPFSKFKNGKSYS